MKQSGLDRRLSNLTRSPSSGYSSDPQKAGHVVIRHLLAGQFRALYYP